MEGDRGLRVCPTAEVVCGNLRNRRWDQLSKQVGFGTKGNSYACRYNLSRKVNLSGEKEIRSCGGIRELMENIPP